MYRQGDAGQWPREPTVTRRQCLGRQRLGSGMGNTHGGKGRESKHTREGESGTEAERARQRGTKGGESEADAGGKPAQKWFC